MAAVRFERCSNSVRTVFERCSNGARTVFGVRTRPRTRTCTRTRTRTYTYTLTIDATNLSVGKGTTFRHYVNVGLPRFLSDLFRILLYSYLGTKHFRRPTAKHAVTTPNFRA